MVSDMKVVSPDADGAGLVSGQLNAHRYSGHTRDPNEVAGTVRSLMPSGVKVLDVGCGTASVTAIANDGKKNKVFCLEPDADRAQITRSKGFETTCGFLDADYIAVHEPFDVVVLTDVLEHLASPDQMVKYARQVLKSNGQLIISVPNAAHWSVRLMLLSGRFEYEDVGLMDATHLRWFTRETLTRLISKNGFEIEAVRYTAGVTLPLYQRGFLSLIPGKVRRFLIRLLRSIRPTLFACQFVISAKVV